VHGFGFIAARTLADTTFGRVPTTVSSNSVLGHFRIARWPGPQLSPARTPPHRYILHFLLPQDGENGDTGSSDLDGPASHHSFGSVSIPQLTPLQGYLIHPSLEGRLDAVIPCLTQSLWGESSSKAAALTDPLTPCYTSVLMDPSL